MCKVIIVEENGESKEFKAQNLSMQYSSHLSVHETGVRRSGNISYNSAFSHLIRPFEME